MKSATVALKLQEKNAEQILTLAGVVRKGFIEQAILFPNPSPAIPVLEDAMENLRKCIIAWGEPGNRGSHRDKLKLQTAVKATGEILTSLAQHAQSNTRNHEALSSIGWELKGGNSLNGKLSQVVNLRQYISGNISAGTLRIKWSKPAGVKRGAVKAYLVYRSETSNYSDAKFLGSVSVTSFTDESPGNGIRFYWVIPTNAAGKGVPAMCKASAAFM